MAGPKWEVDIIVVLIALVAMWLTIDTIEQDEREKKLEEAAKE